MLAHGCADARRTFHLHAIDGGHGWELLLQVLDAVGGAGALEVGEDVGELLWAAVYFGRL